MTMAGCISAMSISQQLGDLDKATDIAVLIRDSVTCKDQSVPMCGMSKSCLSRSLIASMSCKAANDSAAKRDSADVQYINDQACKSDLALASNACNEMKGLYNARDMGTSKDGSNDGLPNSNRDAGHASDARGSHD